MVHRTELALSVLFALAGAVPTTRSATGASAGSTGTTPAVSVKNGTYAGIHLAGFKQDAFLGVPFAQAPVGDLVSSLAPPLLLTLLTMKLGRQRFRHPQSLNYTWTGQANATAYGLGCAVAEDCLFLNVIKPSGGLLGLPVLVWNFGGGFVSGSGVSGFSVSAPKRLS